MPHAMPAEADAFPLTRPALAPPLDPGFRPAALAVRSFEAAARAAGGGPLVLGLERPDGALSRFETVVFPEGHPQAPSNARHVERLFKFLLWQRGGCKAYVGGDATVAQALKVAYAPGGARSFDATFMGRDVYLRPFEVLACPADEVPPAHERSQALGRHLKGCRIGFDLGASDRKVSAVIDGEPVFSEEVVWTPRLQADPEYHFQEVMAALKSAAAHLPRVDAIGGSTAGIVVDNQVRIASLFRGVPPERYGDIRALFQRLGDAWGVPFEVANDGDVTALAGAMSLGEQGVLGVALGSSEAAGYVNAEGHLLGWLNELAFAPVDYAPDAPVDEWSGDRGTGALYFSQQGVFRLAPRAGIALPTGGPDADRLKAVQTLLESGHPGARQIWQSMGIHLGYAIAHYARFYDIRHLLILGRCTSGCGGDLLLEGARQVLARAFPELANLSIQLPDEKNRRVGQSIAAASLPRLP